jgi:ubiquinone/menaquinone biosynthesis C-methylase UbiE
MSSEGYMTEREIKSEWTGIKGRLFAWHLDNSVLRSLETLLLGDTMPAFLSEVSGLIRGDETILDIGAGTGRFSLPMAKRLSTGKIICLDISELMLEYLSQKAEKLGLRGRIQMLNADASSTGLDDGSIDIAISNNVLHELSSPDTVLSEISRVLKTGGHVIITDFRDTFIGRIVSHHGKNAHGPFKISEMESILVKTGFTDLKVRLIRGFLIGIAGK